MRQRDDGSLYDAFPYPGHAYPQTHPDRLATLAALFGVDAAPPAGCRLLEIGCGDGANLLPMALALPGASFVGIDSSGRAIARAREVAQAIGVANARFEEIGIEDYAPPARGFDYVVAHGVFSWVSEPVRERLLGLCAQALSDRGVAFVSYNALPGARVPQTLREFLALQLEGVDDPAERVAGARRLLALLSGPHEGATMLGAEAASLLRHTDATLMHDALAPVNHPLFFREFAALAGAHGLQYLAEANFLEMQVGILPEELQRELLANEDVVLREQALDLLKARRFRQTLLCHAALELDRTLDFARVAGLAVSSLAEASVEDPGEPGRVTFAAPGGGSRLTTDHELVVATLQRARQSWPRAVWIGDLLGDDPSPEATATLCHALLRCYAASVVTLHAHPPALVTRAGAHPVASPLARLQAGEQPLVTSLCHASVEIEDEFGRRLLALLDGTRDRGALRAELEGVAGLEGDALGDALETSLERLAHAGLLVA